jgi:hypothetical protein
MDQQTATFFGSLGTRNLGTEPSPPRRTHGLMLGGTSIGCQFFSPDLEDGGIADPPIVSSFVERFQAPVAARPASSQGRIAIVDVLDGVMDRLPTQILRHPRPDVEVDPRHEQMAPRTATTMS